jgi:hypothetical protein
MADITDRVHSARTMAAHNIEEFKKRMKSSAAGITQKITPKETPEEAIVLVLKHGGRVEGKLLGKTKNDYTVLWKNEKFVVRMDQVARIESTSRKELEWKYKNDVVVRKVNGIVVDGKIIEVKNGGIVVSLDDRGGAEMGIDLKDIGYLEFAPVYNEESRKTEEDLKRLFPKMKFYREGNIVIVTDSYATWVTAYKKTLRTVYTDIYLKSFRLFDGRKPIAQNFVVIFDNPVDFAEYCLTDGVPFWLVLGYFKPTDKVLYLYNAFGKEMEKYAFEVTAKWLGKLDEFIDKVKDAHKIDDRYDIFIDGQIKEVKDKFWNAYNFYKGELTERTLSTLRHEFTHEVFHNWGLQNIVLSSPKIDKAKLIAKKKEFLDTTDLEKKKELFKILMKMSDREDEGVEFEASQSWLNEGLATYFGTEIPGTVDENWLFLYQDMDRKNEVNPIEFITNFRMGSFPGLCHKAQLGAYAQSWALTNFLMDRYPDQFMMYQKRLAEQTVKNDDDRLSWLLEALGKDLPTLEKEFRVYMAGFRQTDDPDVRQFMKYDEIFRR